MNTKVIKNMENQTGTSKKVEEKVIVAQINENNEVINTSHYFKSLEEAEKKSEELQKRIKAINYLKSNRAFVNSVVENLSKNDSVIVDDDDDEYQEYVIILCPRSEEHRIKNYCRDNSTVISKKEIVKSFAIGLSSFLDNQISELKDKIIK